MSNQTPYFIGIDGGGTKCKARLENSQGQLLAETTVGPANAARDLPGSVAALLEASNQLLQIHGDPALKLSQIHAGIGLAGVNLPCVKRKINDILLPFASVQMTTDLHIACLGAHQGEDGAIVILGTGSSGLAMVGGEVFEYGGHGFVVGDKGSGAWIGRKAISLTLETLDGIHPANDLSDAVLSGLNCKYPYEVLALTLNAKPSVFAQLAPLVFQQAQLGQIEALEIVQRGANYVNQLSERLLSHKPQRLAFIGGVSSSLLPYLDSRIQAQAKPALNSPEQGAILLAKSRYLAS